MEKKSIVIIVVYFGNWPPWSCVFLESCKRNRAIAFHIFCDQCPVVEKEGYENIMFHEFSLADFNKLASARLNLSVDIDEPYKICDLRPAFGVIFSAYLTNSSFWGYTDIDLLFGDISQQIDSDLLESYDVLTPRKEYLVGHFTLYRNVRTVNQLYLHAVNYRQVFTSKNYLGFDECGLNWWELIAGRDIFDIAPLNSSMTSVVMHRALQGKLKAFFKTLMLEQNHAGEEFERVLEWNNGELTDHYTGERFLYFHFHYLKRSSTFHCPEWRKVPRQFYVSKHGFVVEPPRIDKKKAI